MVRVAIHRLVRVNFHHSLVKISSTSPVQAFVSPFSHIYCDYRYSYINVHSEPVISVANFTLFNHNNNN